MAARRKFALFTAFLVLAVLLAAGSMWVLLGRPTAPFVPEAPDSETPPRAPSPPGMLLAVPGNVAVLLAWTPPETDGGSPLLGYTVYAGTHPSFLVSRPATRNTLFFTDVGLTNGVVYHYRVVAYNAVGKSSPSEPVAAAPGDFDAWLFAVPRFGIAPLHVEFVLSGLDAALPGLGTSVWDFGDGSGGTVPPTEAISYRAHNISHTYRDPGAYTVTTAYGDEGREFSGPKIPVVVLPPLVMEAVASPIEGTAPLTVSFWATAAGGLPSQSVAWDFGDGMGNETNATEHTYEEAGAYTAIVVARDAAGNEAVQTFEIRVETALAPWAVIVDIRWIVALLVVIGGSGFVLGWLYETRLRTPRE